MPGGAGAFTGRGGSDSSSPGAGRGEVLGKVQRGDVEIEAFTDLEPELAISGETGSAHSDNGRIIDEDVKRI